MDKWQAIVPIKQGAASKSRLSSVLDYPARMALMDWLTGHVLGVLHQCPAVDGIAILSPERPSGWGGAWVEDHGRGLNSELALWRDGLCGAPTLVLHADLPLVSAINVSSFLSLAETHGSALATDRAGLGTNAIALGYSAAFEFRFGPMSRLLHTAQCPAMPVLQSVGLMADLDTPDDLKFAESCGFQLEQSCHWEGSTAAPGLHKAGNQFQEESIP